MVLLCGNHHLLYRDRHRVDPAAILSPSLERIQIMKLTAITLTGYLAFIGLASGGGQLWTRQSYEEAIQESREVFRAKVVAQSQRHLVDGKAVEAPKRDDLMKLIEEGRKVPTIHTHITLQITSIQKGSSFRVGQRIDAQWKDAAFVMCPHAENEALNGKERQWRSVGETFKILPQTLFKKVGDQYVKDEDPPVILSEASSSDPESRPEAE